MRIVRLTSSTVTSWRPESVCLVSCQRSPEPVFLKWKEAEESDDGDFFVRSGPGTVKLTPESARDFIRTRFAPVVPEQSQEARSFDEGG